MDSKWHFDYEWSALKKKVEKLEGEVFWLKKYKDEQEHKAYAKKLKKQEQ